MQISKLLDNDSNKARLQQAVHGLTSVVTYDPDRLLQSNDLNRVFPLRFGELLPRLEKLLAVTGKETHGCTDVQRRKHTLTV